MDTRCVFVDVATRGVGGRVCVSTFNIGRVFPRLAISLDDHHSSDVFRHTNHLHPRQDCGKGAPDTGVHLALEPNGGIRFVI